MRQLERHADVAVPAEDPRESAQPSGAAHGTVRIARRVLDTVVEQAALSVPGVVRLARPGPGWPRSLRAARVHGGVAAAVSGANVAMDVYLVIAPGMHMVTVGQAVQEAVGAAVEHMLGMRVREINVFIQDVE